MEIILVFVLNLTFIIQVNAFVSKDLLVQDVIDHVKRGFMATVVSKLVHGTHQV